MGTLKDQLAQFDEDHDLLRQLIIPEEDRAKYTLAKWFGEYRWFRSPNVVCLEKARRLKAATVQRDQKNFATVPATQSCIPQPMTAPANWSSAH